MAFGDFENTLQGNDLVTKIADYSSAWWDMRHAVQIMHARSELVQDAAHYFVRRGLLDGAIITYSRCFESGRRRADIRALIEAMDDDMKAVHETVDWWRDKHIAHRVDPGLETVSVHLLWSGWKKNPPTVRTRVTTTVIPDHPPGFEQGFQDLADALSVRIWEAFLSPLQQQLFTELGPSAMVELRRLAQPYHVPPTPADAMLVTMDIGSVPPAPDV